jgi:hypothetical protein
MTTGPKHAEVRLSGGPGNGQTFGREDWHARILAAHRMGRTTPDGAGWALGYAIRQQHGREGDLGLDGRQLPPVDQVDPELLRPYGAFLQHASYDVPPAAVPDAAA